MEIPFAAGRKIWTVGMFVIVLSCALVVCFPGIIFGTHTLFYRDFSAYIYPLHLFTRNSLLNGELPLWNPYVQCGVPHMAQLGSWYPPVLLATFLPLPWSLNFIVVLHLVWGGSGVYLLARDWSLERFAASFAGMAAVFNGVVLSSLQWPSYVAVLSWAPWVILFVLRSWERGGRSVVPAALSSAMQVLCGMPELTALTWVFLAILWFSSLLQRRRVKSLGEMPANVAVSQNASAGKSALRTVWIILLASGLTFFQTLPFLDLVAHSQRNPASASDMWSMPGWGWANLFVPLFHCYVAPQGTWFQAGQDLVQSYYPGLGVMFLAAIGAWRTRNRVVWSLVVMVLLCWIMALGSNGGIYTWLKKAVPLIGFARFPIKFVALPAMLIPLLAAWGIQNLMQDQNARAMRSIAAATSCAVVLVSALLWFAKKYPFRDDLWDQTAVNAGVRLGLMGLLFACLIFDRRSQHPKLRIALGVVMLAILPLDAITHSPNLAPSLPSDVLAKGMWQATGKPQPPRLGEGRIMISPAAERQLTFSYITNLNMDLTCKRAGEWYNFNLIDGIPKVNGAMPLHSAYYDIFETRLYYTSGVVFGPGLLDFLGARWYSSEENPMQWFFRGNALPVLTGGQKPIFATDAVALEKVFAPDFDGSQVVYLPEEARKSVTVSNGQPAKITAAAFNLNRIEASVDSPAPAMVVVSQTFYHLWNAFVDEKPVPLLRANFAFQAIEIPTGNHRIKLIYRDYNFMIGSLISVASVIFCAVLWRKERPTAAQV